MDEKIYLAATKLAEEIRTNAAECIKISLAAFRKGEKADFANGDVRVVLEMRNGEPYSQAEYKYKRAEDAPGAWRYLHGGRWVNYLAYNIAADACEEYHGVAGAAKEARAYIKRNLDKWVYDGQSRRCDEYDRFRVEKEGETSDGTKWWFSYERCGAWSECELLLGEDADEKIWCADILKMADDTTDEMIREAEREPERDEYGYEIR